MNVADSLAPPGVSMPPQPAAAATVAAAPLPHSTAAASAAAASPFPSPAPAAMPTPLSTPLALQTSSGVPSWSSTPRLVSEVVFDSWHTEVVAYFSRQIRALALQRGEGSDAKALAKKTYGKIESLGFSIGVRLVERWSRDSPLLDQQLETVKFLCKDFWSALFRKQVDKLQTNYKGVYVLHDLNFRWTARVAPLSAETDAAALNEQARIYTALAVGILRGAMANLGMSAAVKADIAKLPAVQFTIVAAGAQQQQQQAAAGGAQAAPATTTAPGAPMPSLPATRPASGSASAGTSPATTARLRPSVSASTLPPPATAAAPVLTPPPIASKPPSVTPNMRPL